MDPTVLDTEAFAPLPREIWRRHAEHGRPGLRVLHTPGSLVRVRDSLTDRPGEQPTPAPPSAVLFTDAPHTVECYDELLARLSPGVRLVVVEPPGFGFSWVTDPVAFTLSGATASLVSALHQLDVNNAVLGGACVYGFLALTVARSDPSLAKALLLAQTPSWDAARRWGRDVLDPDGQLSVPWEGQARWRLNRHAMATSWYRFAAGRAAPLDRWQDNARQALDTGASYALASHAQRWWIDDIDGPGPVALPAVVLWGEADRSHRKAGTNPDDVLDLLPHGRVVRLPAVGHFADTEDVEATADALLDLLVA